MIVNDIEIIVTKKRMKNMYLRIRNGEVSVSAPLRTSDKVIREFVLSRMSWIKTHLSKQSPCPDEPVTAKMREQLAGDIAPLIEKWSAAMGVNPAAWRIRQMRSRWGSCNTLKKSINFSAQLACKSAECVEYVVVHELAHLIEKGHGREFKAVMDSFLPGWRILKNRLNNKN